MKVYEKLGLPKLTKEQCRLLDELCLADDREEECKRNPGGYVCADCVYDYLNSNVPAKRVKRWETYNGDFINARRDFQEYCDGIVCADCPIYFDDGVDCFACWLMEEIEVEI